MGTIALIRRFRYDTGVTLRPLGGNPFRPSGGFPPRR